MNNPLDFLSIGIAIKAQTTLAGIFVVAVLYGVWRFIKARWIDKR